MNSSSASLWCGLQAAASAYATAEDPVSRRTGTAEIAENPSAGGESTLFKSSPSEQASAAAGESTSSLPLSLSLLG